VSKIGDRVERIKKKRGSPSQGNAGAAALDTKGETIVLILQGEELVSRSTPREAVLLELKSEKNYSEEGISSGCRQGYQDFNGRHRRTLARNSRGKGRKTAQKEQIRAIGS